jgi:hypothetical protein
MKVYCLLEVKNDMIFILIEGNFYKVYTSKFEVLKAYAKNKNAKIYTKKLLKGKN